MKRLIVSIIFICGFMTSYSQDDILYLYKRYFLLNGKKYNQLFNGKKNGAWIEFGLKHAVIMASHWDGWDTLTNQPTSGTDFKVMEYIPIKESVNSEMNQKDRDFYSCNSNIVDKITPDTYFIKARGNYKNGLKEGLWKYYHSNGVINKEVLFVKGKIMLGFNVYRDDNTLMMKITQINEDIFEVCRYSGKKELLNCKNYYSYEIEEIL